MSTTTPNLGLFKYNPATDGTQTVDLVKMVNEPLDKIDAALPIHSMARQALINGNFDVWQRGTAFTNPASGNYLADRWRVDYVNSGTLPTSIINTRLPLSGDEVPGSVYADRMTINGAGTGFGANDTYNKRQKIDNGTRLLCGTGRKITVSFWARSLNIAGKKIGVKAFQHYGTGGSPSAGESLAGANFTLTTSWTRYSFTFTTNTLAGKTFGTSNDDYLSIEIAYMWGATRAAEYGAGSTAETFGGAGDIDIAQVQVCAGDTALPFQPRSFGEELAACQRYYEKSYNYNTVPGATADGNLVSVTLPSAGNAYHNVRYQVRKRGPSSVTIYDRAGNAGKITINGTDNNAFYGYEFPGDAGFTLTTNSLATNSSIRFHWTVDAEI